MPQISINIITYNRAQYLEESINSVLKQNFQDWELIIIDDASTDNTSDILKTYTIKDERIKIFKTTSRLSISQVRNLALSHSRGKYIAILDSDDSWSDPEKLTKQYNFLENNPKYILVGSGAILITNTGEEREKILKPSTDEEIRKNFFIKNPIFHSSVMYHREPVISLSSYKEEFTGVEDFDLWLRLGKIGSLYNFPEYLIKYRLHPDNQYKKAPWATIIKTIKVINANRKSYHQGKMIAFKKIFSKLLEYLK